MAIAMTGAQRREVIGFVREEVAMRGWGDTVLLGALRNLLGELTLPEVGLALGTTRQAANQVAGRALSKLRRRPQVMRMADAVFAT